MEISERLWGMVRKMKPYLATVFLQISFAVMYTIVAVSLKHGLSHFVFSVYRHAVATLFIVPFALILERLAAILNNFFPNFSGRAYEFDLIYILPLYSLLRQENKAYNDVTHLLKNIVAWIYRVILLST